MPSVILSIKLEDKKWVNRVSFEISNVPCNWSVWYRDPDREVMVALSDIDGHSVSGTIVPDAERVNGQYIFSALTEFVRQEVSTAMIETNEFEVRVDRDVPFGVLDSDYVAVIQSYPISIRNWEVMLEVTGRNTMPPTYDEKITIRDPLGHIERMVTQEWDSSKAIDGSLNTYWRCEPQPVSTAVVPFYLDVRAANGDPQLIDKLELDPIYTGPTCNIYYSNDDATPGSFAVSYRRMALAAHGAASIIAGSGARFTSVGDGFSISNDSMRFDPEQDWVVGVVYEPDVGYTGTGTRTLWEMDLSTGTISLQYDGTAHSFRVLSGATVKAETASQTFAVGDPLVIVVSRTWGTGWSIAVSDFGDRDFDWTTPQSGTDASAGAGIYLDSFYVGADAALSTRARGFIRDIWVRQEAYDPLVAQAFSTNNRPFMLRTGPPDKVRSDYNAVLVGRLTSDEMVNVGPSFDLYELKEWTPVYRDYRLQKGITDLPPIRCKYLKLEFSDLVPRPYPLWDKGVERVVRDYPQWVHKWYGDIEQRTRYVKVAVKRKVATGGLRVNYNQGGQARSTIWYGDEGVRAGILNRAPVEYENTRGLAFDPTQYGNYTVEPEMLTSRTSYSMRAFTENVGRQIQRKFFRIVRHEYDVRTVKVSHQQAYFVGLRDVKVHRVDYTAAEDSPVYLETFGDSSHLAAYTMELDTATGQMVATGIGQYFRTKVLSSHSKFKSIQLAASGTDYESQFSDEQIGLEDTAHTTDLTGTTRTTATLITGEGVGTVLEFTPTTPGVEYGTRTNTGIYQSAAGEQYDYVLDTYDSGGSYDADRLTDPANLRLTGVARVYLPDTANGTYALRLWAAGVVVEERRFAIPPRKWTEIELTRLSVGSDVNLQIEIAQINTAVSERFDLDMLAIFQNPILWEISNDGGVTYQAVRHGINDPNAHIQLPAAGNELVVRATALRAGASVQAFQLIPSYTASPIYSRISESYLERGGVNELDAYRPTRDKPAFKVWSRPWPRRYSISQRDNSTTIGPAI